MTVRAPGSFSAFWMVFRLTWASGALVRIVVVGPLDWTRTNAESLKLISATVRLLAGMSRSSKGSTIRGSRATRREASRRGRTANWRALADRVMREPLEMFFNVCPGEWLRKRDDLQG